MDPARALSYQEQLKHPEQNHASLIKGLNSILILVAVSILGLHFYARYRTKTRYGWDDALAVLTFALSITLIMLFIVTAGQSRHFVFLTSTQLQLEMRIIYASQYLYIVACGSYKAAICHYYLRIFDSPKAVLQIRATLILIWTLVLSCTLVLPFECKPLNHAWELLTPGTCIDIPAYLIATAILSTVVDLIVIILPLPFIYTLQLSRRRMIPIAAVFFLGAVVVISSIMRAYYIKNLVIGPDSYDPSYRNTVPSLLTVCELTLGLACACLPTIWSLSFMKPKTSASTSNIDARESKTLSIADRQHEQKSSCQAEPASSNAKLDTTGEADPATDETASNHGSVDQSYKDEPEKRGAELV